MKQKKRMNSKKTISREFSAGGIVFRQTSRGPEIAFIEDPWHKWTFPKGHIEKGETPEEAALRETAEEMGISSSRLKVIKPLGRIDWWFYERRKNKISSKGSLVHKFVYYFLMQVPARIRFQPQLEEKIYQIKWVPVDKAFVFSGYQDLKPVLQKAIRFLIKNFS
jgi:8-oxo-dGTP pyrophosphatase MutT (NUDIX family)